MQRTAGLGGSLSLVRTFRNTTGCRPAGTGFTLVPGWEAMSTRARGMHLYLPFDGQPEEALANSTQVDRDREKGRIQGSGITSYLSSKAGGCMEARLLSTLFPHRTPHKLLHSALGDATGE